MHRSKNMASRGYGQFPLCTYIHLPWVKVFRIIPESGFWGWLSTASQPQNANEGDYNGFTDLFSVCLMTIDHLNLKLWIYLVALLQVLRWDLKVQNFWNFELSPMIFSDSNGQNWKKNLAEMVSRWLSTKIAELSLIHQKTWLGGYKTFHVQLNWGWNFSCS